MLPVVKIEMSVDWVQPADLVSNHIVGVKVKDIDLAEKLVIEDEIAALGTWCRVTEVMFRESFTQFRPVRVNAVDVRLADDDEKAIADVACTDEVDVVVEVVV